jgi:hypothetical protein
MRSRNYLSVEVVKVAGGGMSVDVDSGGVALWTSLEVRVRGVASRDGIRHDEGNNCRGAFDRRILSRRSRVAEGVSWLRCGRIPFTCRSFDRGALG